MEDDFEEMRALRASTRYKMSTASQRAGLRPNFRTSSTDWDEPSSSLMKSKALDEVGPVSDRLHSSHLAEEDQFGDSDKTAGSGKKKQDHNQLDDLDEAEISRLMGFDSFGKKKTEGLDMEKLLRTTRLKLDQPTAVTLRQTQPHHQPVPSGGNGHGIDGADNVVGPLPPTDEIQRDQTSAPSRQSDSSDDENIVDDDDAISNIPAVNELTLHHGSRVVSCLALDAPGTRLVSGSFECDVMMWDFATMDSSLRSFRQFSPVESHAVKTIQYSYRGDRLLVATGSAQLKILDRDGRSLMETVKGDQYLVDLSNTKGHVAMVNAACWNPQVDHEFISCSNDGTVRIWNTSKEEKNLSVLKTKDGKAKKTSATYCMFSTDASLVMTACQDGSLQAWDRRKTSASPLLLCRTAHQIGSTTSCLSMAYDGRQFISRGGDNTVKLWDLRNFKQPVCTADGLPNMFESTKCIFSPDDKLVVTGTSAAKGEKDGDLVFLDRNNLQKVFQIPTPSTGAVSCLWHPKLNQIMIGCSNGEIRVVFDPDRSFRGVTMCMGRVKVRHFDVGENLITGQVITPYSLRMYRQERVMSIKKMKEKARSDPTTSRKPEPPLYGPGQGGRITSGMSLSAYLVKQLAVQKPPEKEENPREALLKYAKVAAENPYFVSNAYAKTQPKPIFSPAENSEEGGSAETPNKRFRS